MIQIRKLEVWNPEYPTGMTMRDLVTNSEGPWCVQCGRQQKYGYWVDNDHDGFCPVPFMRAAQELLDEIEPRVELAIHKIEQTLEGQYPDGQALKAALSGLYQVLNRNFDEPNS